MSLHPCGSCPYRRDVPGGVWHREEYEMLPEYDRLTPFQPTAAFFCHQQTGELCAGWVGCHDMSHSLGLRFAAVTGAITREQETEALDHVPPVPLWSSGAEACAHGLAEIEVPSEESERVSQRLRRKGLGQEPEDEVSPAS